MRIRFKDYGFFVPLDSAGTQALLEGQLVIRELSKEDAAHLEGEGAKVNRDETGKAIEIGLVASALELRRGQ